MGDFDGHHLIVEPDQAGEKQNRFIDGVPISFDHAVELLESITDAFYGLDSDWRFFYINAKAEQLLGKKREDLLGKHIWEEYPEAVNGQTYITMHQARATRQTARYELFSNILNTWLEVEVYPTQTGLAVYFRDIAQRKQVEQNASRLAAIVTSSNDAIISETLDGIITSWNPGAERVFGYTASEVIGKPITILFPEDRLHEEVDFLQKIAAGELVQNYDTIRLTKDGTEVFVWVSLSPLKDAQGEIVGATKIAQDISARKRAEREIRQLNENLEQLVEARTTQLKAANQELDAFAYVVSHDLKAPLRGITQLATWLATDYAASIDEEGRKLLQILVGRSRRMHEMIEGILQHSRIGRLRQNLTQFALNQVVDEVVDLLAPPETIEITVAPDLPNIYADEIHIRQVFQNLVGNAIKYMDKPLGKISITFTDDGSHWQFAVADNGPGIEAQYHDKIFQLFQTLSSRDDIEATGIGLALVKKIVELHNGRVWLTSVVGQGTTFYFTLPKFIESPSS